MARASFALFGALVAIGLAAATPLARAGAACADDATKSIAEAKAALDADDSTQDRHALICLVQAVEALSATVDGLQAGSVRFKAPLPLAKTKADTQAKAGSK